MGICAQDDMHVEVDGDAQIRKNAPPNILHHGMSCLHPHHATCYAAGRPVRSLRSYNGLNQVHNNTMVFPVRNNTLVLHANPEVVESYRQTGVTYMHCSSKGAAGPKTVLVKPGYVGCAVRMLMQPDDKPQSRSRMVAQAQAHPTSDTLRTALFYS